MVFTDPPYGVSIVDRNAAINAVDPGKGGCIEKTSSATRSGRTTFTSSSSRR